jgi:hypothetical protein
MTSDTYKPVRINSKKAIAEAENRPGFPEAWDALEEQYAALSALLKARRKAGLTKEKLTREK